MWATIIQACFSIIGWFIEKKQNNEKLKKLHVDLGKALREVGVKRALSRFESEGQIDSGNAAWDQVENPEKTQE